MRTVGIQAVRRQGYKVLRLLHQVLAAVVAEAPAPLYALIVALRNLA